MASTFWSDDEIRIALVAMLNRIENRSHNVKLEHEDHDLKISCYDHSPSSSNSIYITITQYSIYMSLNNHSGFYKMKNWFFQDRELKRVIKKIRFAGIKYGTGRSEALIQCFPEVFHNEFEKQVLGVEDGEEKT